VHFYLNFSVSECTVVKVIKSNKIITNSQKIMNFEVVEVYNVEQLIDPSQCNLCTSLPKKNSLF